MISSLNFFTNKLLADLDDKPALEGMEEALRESRKVGFDYLDDNEAVAHFKSEVEEVVEAFFNASAEAVFDEAADVQFLLGELVRRRGGSLASATRQNTRKYLMRLNFVEKTLQEQGKTWADVKWPHDIKPLWKKAKEAGL